MSAPHPGSTGLAARARRFARAFTLIELTVSLVAGLMVAMAVAVLSHESTATFNEEIRVSAAEATLRGAADRLRSDLERASFMSTPNIEMDPNLAKLFGQATNLPLTASAPLRSLQSILITPGDTATNGLALDTVNGIVPPKIDITGNLTSADQFEVQAILPNALGTCCLINLAASSPSIFRMLNANDAGVPDPNADTELQNVFAPAPAIGGAGGSAFTKSQFWVRYVDTATNHAQYIPTCDNAGGQIAGMGIVGGIAKPYVYTANCPLTGAQTGTITATNGNTAGLATVNPIQTARWEITTNVPAQDINALDNTPLQAGVQDPAKYDLVRWLVDAKGNTLPETEEVIAEYAVNIDFAFSVDSEAYPAPDGGPNPSVVALDFGDSRNATVAGSVFGLLTSPRNGGSLTGTQPQRIRSIRFEIETRAAQADRKASIPVQTVADGGGGQFLYRYCMTATGCSGTSLTQWARVRTLVGEVGLSNQQQAFY